MASKMTEWRRANPEKAKALYLRNRERTIERSVARTKRLVADRKALLAQFPCVCCGEANPDVIQWHHVDPEEKDHTIFSGGFGEERFWDEVLKCIPVCANCHLLLHKNKLCLINPTGFRQQQDTVSTYVRDSISPP